VIALAERGVSHTERSGVKHKTEAVTLRVSVAFALAIRKGFEEFTFCYIVRFVCAYLLRWASDRYSYGALRYRN
jgi:hypothetical protein